MNSQTDSNVLLQKEVALDSIDNLAKDIISFLPNSAIVLLEGNLAAGKTTLVKSIVKALGLSSEDATSPTFSLQQSYGDKIFHYDFYRVDFDEVANLGLIEEFEKEGLHFLEWPNEKLVNLLKEAGFNIYLITIDAKEEDKREYILEVINA